MNAMPGGLLLSVLVLSAPGAGAEVVHVADNGFSLRNEVVVAAPADEVWKALVRVGRWWDSEHTYSGDARRMSIEVRPGGCFCERLEHRGGVVHGEVVYVAPGKTLRLASALGPLQQEGVAGALTWNLVAEGDGTKLSQTYNVGGYRQGGFADLAPLVDQVLATQLRRLHHFIETGTP